MNSPAEAVSAFLMIATLLGLGGYFGRKQWLTLRDLPARFDLPPEDLAYHRVQSSRRLISSVLMIVLGLMLLSWYLFFDQQALADGNRDARRLFGSFWLTVIALVLVLMILACLDLLAIRRYGLRQLRKIQEDRRQMVERQANVMRSQRNGHGE